MLAKWQCRLALSDSAGLRVKGRRAQCTFGAVKFRFKVPQQKFLITLKAADKSKMLVYDDDDDDDDVQVYPAPT